MTEDTTPTPQQTVDAETADMEFERFCSEMDIDNDEAFMSAEDKEAYLTAKRVITRAMMQGKLVINDNGEPIYTDMDGKDIRFREMTGAMLRETDKVSAKEGGDMAKMMRLMGAITGRGPKFFSEMVKRDLKVCQTIVGFMQG